MPGENIFYAYQCIKEIFEDVNAYQEDKAFLNNKRCFAYKYPNGESMMQVAYRVYGLLDAIKCKYENENVLIISHGGVCRIINTYFTDMTNEEFFIYSIEIAKIKKYER